MGGTGRQAPYPSSTLTHEELKNCPWTPSAGKDCSFHHPEINSDGSHSYKQLKSDNFGLYISDQYQNR